MNRLISIGLVCVIVLAVVAAHPKAYVTFGKWSSSSVMFYANPTNADVSASAAEAALQAGLNAWSTQANAAFRYTYGGRVNDTSTGYDGRNVILFRNSSNGGALASTYWWTSGSNIVDADVVIWDGAYTFFTGTSGCSGGAYIEDISTHELGHALGLDHSSDPSATMYPGYSYCSQELRSLAADDISGAQSLYGRSTNGSSNTAPSVTVTSPTASSFAEGTSISFAGSASDAQDGDLTAKLLWKSSVSGQIGTGGFFTLATLPVGTHTITASVTDSGGLAASSQPFTISVADTSTTTTTTSTGQPTLTASTYKVKRSQRVDLAWQNVTTSSVDVYRNGARVTTTANDSAWTDSMNVKAAGTYRYAVCAAGTSTCSNEAVVTF